MGTLGQLPLVEIISQLCVALGFKAVAVLMAAKLTCLACCAAWVALGEYSRGCCCCCF